jgi:hypothetical protein
VRGELVLPLREFDEPDEPEPRPADGDPGKPRTIAEKSATPGGFTAGPVQ